MSLKVSATCILRGMESVVPLGWLQAISHLKVETLMGLLEGMGCENNQKMKCWTDLTVYNDLPSLILPRMP